MTAAPLDLVDRKAALAESLRKLRRGLEMSASIMRDPERTGGWDGSERVANSYDRFRIQVEKIEAEIAALPSYPAPAGDVWLPIETLPVPIERVESYGSGRINLAEVDDEAAFLILYSEPDEGGVSSPIGWQHAPTPPTASGAK